MIGDEKEVYYNLYCKSCKNEKVAEDVEPCHDCLNEPARVDTHKPLKWEEK